MAHIWIFLQYKVIAIPTNDICTFILIKSLSKSCTSIRRTDVYYKKIIKKVIFPVA